MRRVWGLVDPRVRHTQAVCRLRALVLAGVATIGVSVVGSAGRGATSQAVADDAAVPAGVATSAAPAAPPTSSPASSPATSPAAPPTSPPTSPVPSTTTTAPATTSTTAPATTSTTPPPAPAPPPAPGAPAPLVTRIETADPVVFVTVDDGFDRSPETAAVLDQLDMPVTAFLVDRPVEVGADYFRSLPGATVQAHTRTHTDLPALSEADQQAEICGNADTIAGAFGRRPSLFRPPYGNHDDATLRAAAACGMSAVVLWEVVVDDGSLSYRTVPEIRRGDIVLLHFTEGLPNDLRVLSRVVEDAGLTVARLEDYLPG